MQTTLGAIDARLRTDVRWTRTHYPISLSLCGAKLFRALFVLESVPSVVSSVPFPGAFVFAVGLAGLGLRQRKAQRHAPPPRKQTYWKSSRAAAWSSEFYDGRKCGNQGAGI